MITIYLSGGLGNQMFQFAAAYKLAKISKSSLKINIDDYDSNIRNYELDKFPFIKKNYTPNVKKSLIHWKILRFFNFLSNKKHFYEAHPFVFDHAFLEAPKNSDLHGYFQSEKYFTDIRSDILKVFEFKKNIDAPFLVVRKDILGNNSVSLHVRRGDLVSNKSANKYHGILSISYYKKAIKIIELHVKKPKYFLFSDDLIWAKNNFHFLKDLKLVDINQGSLAYRDVQLMSLCKHNIIANSSFSWWGAWLNKNPRKIVIAPKKWLKVKKEPLSDIIPESWHAI